MKHSKRKKRRAQPSKLQNSGVSGNSKNNAESEEEKIIYSLVEAFSLASVEEAEAAYKEANGDPNKAAEILCGLSESSEGFQASCSSSSQSFGLDTNSNSSEGIPESNGFSVCNSSRSSRGGRGKGMVATTGTVSTVLGKNYVTSSSRKDIVKEKRLGDAKVDIEEAEQFLCSMLGDDCELNMGVVRDVLCNCGFDVEKALEVLLDLSAPCETSGSEKYSSSSSCSSSVEYFRNIDCIDGFWQLADRGSDSNSYSSEGDVPDNVRFLDFNGRSYAEALVSSDDSSKSAAASLRTDGPELPRQVLESLFHIPKNSEEDPSIMNWRNVVKQMESFAQKRVQLGPSSFIARELSTQAKGAEYMVFRETARQEWDKMRTCYQKGKLCSKVAREADEKASMQIFKARNKGIENILTIDLHGQHVKPALRLVKLHLLFGTYISSVQYIRIITGCGSSGLGKSMLKQSVVKLLKKEGIEWKEENQGTVLIRLDGPREFSFLDSGSDSESD
ncbi:SMR domain-containing protein At5g58720 isoform X2 [Spinacia oleracea]|uniref:SMR domain-containing protein At5g58720 isoform X2 n=1 Tax=Spinacia oleracea TaxID=3562 RepID=A0ABM3QJV5_SPIOL|nr:SMR domain-containing protein At5g58720 isoform X2 [Spinacia oleracea]